MPEDPLIDGFPQGSAFPLTHRRVDRILLGMTSSRLHFDEDDHAFGIVVRNDVDLQSAEARVALADVVAQSAQIGHSCFFTGETYLMRREQ